MNDELFLTRFTDLTLPPSEFGHLGHMRLGWILLQGHGAAEAIERACEGIAAYAAHLGAHDKFHRTVTEALMHLLLEAGAHDRQQDWDAFVLRAAPLMADARARLARHYSSELLNSELARRQFLAPDLAPLPA